MKKTQKTFAIIVSLICVLAFAASPCLADSADGIMPRWTGISSITSFLEFFGAEGEATLAATKNSDATSIEGIVTVYKNVEGQWIYVDSLTSITTRNTVFVSIVFEATSGVEYKMEVEVTAYNGTIVIEEFTETKYKTCP